MEPTRQNVEAVRNELSLELFLYKEKYADKLNSEQMQRLDDEIDEKILKMLPNYSGKIPVREAFEDILKRTVDAFCTH